MKRSLALFLSTLLLQLITLLAIAPAQEQAQQPEKEGPPKQTLPGKKQKPPKQKAEESKMTPTPQVGEPQYD